MTPFEERVLNDLSAIRSDMTARLAVLEDHDEKCYGNGQPGWKAQHEKDLATLMGERNRQSGVRDAAGWVCGTVLSIGTVIAEFLIHRK